MWLEGGSRDGDARPSARYTPGMSFQSRRRRFIGLDNQVQVTTLDGSITTITETYLDSAATSLVPESVFLTTAQYLEFSCANSHTHASARGRATTKAIEDTRALVGELVGASADDAVVFCGNGSTAALNLAAEVLYPEFRSAVPEALDRYRSAPKNARSLVFISEMEHHSNMLPWRRAAGMANVSYIPVFDDGTIDMANLRAMLARNSGRVRVVAVTAMSNVTGVINDVHAIARLAHDAGAVIVVDAAQAAPHIPLNMHPAGPDEALDFVALSGHKLFAPGSPGVLVGPRETIAKAQWRVGDVGGGIVTKVEWDSVELLKNPAQRLEAGTPNIPGIVTLGAGVLFLKDLGLGPIREHEIALTSQAITELARIPECVVYGPTDPNLRGGIVSFNLFGIPHGLVAAVLQDCFGIASRNMCFCAEPFVRQMLDAVCNNRGFCAPVREGHRGMCRASFSPFTGTADITRLTTAVAWIAMNIAKIQPLYEGVDGVFTSKTFRPQPVFDLVTTFEAVSV